MYYDISTYQHIHHYISTSVQVDCYHEGIFLRRFMLYIPSIMYNYFTGKYI